MIVFISSTPLTGGAQDDQSVWLEYQYDQFLGRLENFINVLNSSQRNALIHPLDDPARTTGFCYVLTECDTPKGLRLLQLNGDQRRSFHNALSALLSSQGYQKSIGVMRRQGVLEEMESTWRAYPRLMTLMGPTLVDLENGMSPQFNPAPGRSSLEYAIGIFGSPEQSFWALRIEGHHLMLNFTFSRSAQGVISVSPFPIFLGANPGLTPPPPDFPYQALTAWREETGKALLWRQASLAREVIALLPRETREKANWGENAPSRLYGGTQVPLETSDLKKRSERLVAIEPYCQALCQNVMTEYIQEYLRIPMPSISARISVEQIASEAKIAWHGDWENSNSPFYLRIVSGDYLIELSASNGYQVVKKGAIPPAIHIHSAIRNVSEDWDKDLMRKHLHEEHIHEERPDAKHH